SHTARSWLRQSACHSTDFRDWGRVNRKTAPCGRFGVAHTRPPCASMIDQADRQPDTHAAGFGRVERVEEPVEALRLQPGARVLYRDERTFGSILLCPDEQLPRRLARFRHGVYSVEDQASITC